MFGELLLPGSLLWLQQLGVGVLLRDASVGGKCAPAAHLLPPGAAGARVAAALGEGALPGHLLPLGHRRHHAPLGHSVQRS